MNNINRAINNSVNNSIKNIKTVESVQLMTAASVIIIAIGLKHVLKDFEEHCNVHFNTRLMKNITVFALVFVYTKNITISVFFAIIYNFIHLAFAASDSKNCEETEDEEIHV